ncbi:hypothetical protein B0T14DRAFT_504402 [Immersiella caudata]|uniref:Uncharacterized protein n=1 Tax=Immersiella caudata TaxID=314043 RepID=A0AA39XEN0_9PEZI|nr:hypothetical protein B0T14DRAFT_504402 [Immersiella caudata]
MCQEQRWHYLCDCVEPIGKIIPCKNFKPSVINRLGGKQHCGDLTRTTTDVLCPKHRRGEREKRLGAKDLVGSRNYIRVLQQTARGTTGFTPVVSSSQKARDPWPLATSTSFEFSSPHLSKHATPKAAARRQPATIQEEDALLEVYERARQGALLAANAAGSLAASQRMAEALAAEEREEARLRGSGLRLANPNTCPDAQLRRYGDVRYKPGLVENVNDVRSEAGSIRGRKPSPLPPASTRAPTTRDPRVRAPASQVRAVSTLRRNIPQPPPPRASSALRADPPSSYRSISARKPVPTRETPAPTPATAQPTRGQSSASSQPSRSPPRASLMVEPLNIHRNYANYMPSGAELDPAVMRPILRSGTVKSKKAASKPATEEYVVSPVSSADGLGRTPLPVSPVKKLHTTGFGRAGSSARAPSPRNPPTTPRRVDKRKGVDRTPTDDEDAPGPLDPFSPKPFRRRYERQQALRGVPAVQQTPSSSSTASRAQASSRTPTSTMSQTQASSATRATSQTKSGVSRAQASSSSREQATPARSSRVQLPTIPRRSSSASRDRSDYSTAPASTPRSRPDQKSSSNQPFRTDEARGLYPPNATKSRTKSRTKKFIKMITCQTSVSSLKAEVGTDEQWACRGSLEVERKG